jgi:hypothetical protein
MGGGSGRMWANVGGVGPTPRTHSGCRAGGVDWIGLAAVRRRTAQDTSAAVVVTVVVVAISVVEVVVWGAIVVEVVGDVLVVLDGAEVDVEVVELGSVDVVDGGRTGRRVSFTPDVVVVGAASVVVVAAPLVEVLVDAKVVGCPVVGGLVSETAVLSGLGVT